MATQVTRKSGKGIADGVVSELATFWEVLPGHEEELRAASKRLVDAIKGLDPEKSISTGLRDARLVIFDDGRRFLFATTFEADWDPYIEDAILVVGVKHFIDWMQHTIPGNDVVAWVESYGGTAKMDELPEQEARKATGRLKEILQSCQSPAASYFNALGPYTLPQINKAMRVQQAFQQTLDDPAAEEALKQPALKPLLEQAAV